MYKKIEPLIENTLCEACETSRGAGYHRVIPVEGYKLHEKGLDMPIFDEKTGRETNKIERGYTTGFTTVSTTYDWEKNERQIYAVPVDTEVEIIEREDAVEGDTTSDMAEKAKAYDIIMGVAE